MTTIFLGEQLVRTWKWKKHEETIYKYWNKITMFEYVWVHASWSCFGDEWQALKKKTISFRPCKAPISGRLAGPFQQLVRHWSTDAIGQFPRRKGLAWRTNWKRCWTTWSKSWTTWRKSWTTWRKSWTIWRKGWTIWRWRRWRRSRWRWSSRLVEAVEAPQLQP